MKRGSSILKKTMLVKLSIIVLLLIFVTVISGFTGYYIGKNSSVNNSDLLTFYATVINVDTNYFHVDGLDINDINTRNEFVFTINNETQLSWRGTVMDLTEFKHGQTIAITYTGEVLETYPGKIVEVVRIQLLDDEK